MVSQAFAQPGVCRFKVILANVTKKMKMTDEVVYARKNLADSFADTSTHIADTGQRDAVVSVNFSQKRNDIVGMLDPSIQAIQLQALEKRNVPISKLPAEIVVLILAAFIRQPELSFEQLAKVITRHRRIVLDAAQIEELFALHGLKKTIQTAVPKP